MQVKGFSLDKILVDEMIKLYDNYIVNRFSSIANTLLAKWVIMMSYLRSILVHVWMANDL